MCEVNIMALIIVLLIVIIMDSVGIFRINKFLLLQLDFTLI